MLLGFLGCVVPKTISALKGITLPMYADPFFIGIVMSVVGVVAGSRLRAASGAELAQYEKLHIQPESEKDVVAIRKTHNLFAVYIAFGVVLGVFFVLAYAMPYMKAIN